VMRSHVLLFWQQLVITMSISGADRLNAF